MKPRMMCTDCFRTAEADTVLEGSDLVELLAWCCFALPGLLYCWWRHALRIKVCGFCGGRELVREARAAAERDLAQDPPFGGGRVRSLAGGWLWPRPLSHPRERLRHGGVLACLAAAVLASAALAALDPGVRGGAVAAANGLAAACAGWCAYQVLRVSQLRSASSGYRAWDHHGRPLRIERIP